MRATWLIAMIFAAGCTERAPKPKIDEEKRDKTDFAALIPQAKDSGPEAIAAFRRGQQFERNREFDKAIEEYSQAIKLEPSLAHAFNNRAMCWKEKGSLDKAITDLNEAIRLEPKASHIPYINRGNVWRAKKDFEKALVDFGKAIDMRPDRLESWEARAQLLCDAKEFEKGIKDFDEVIKLKPNHHGALYDRGLAWYTLRDYDKAIADFSDAIKFQPFDDSYFNDRGRSWHKKKEYAKAIDDFGRAIDLNAKSHHYKNRGAAWHDQKEYKKAIDDFEAALRLNKNDLDSIAVLARLLSSLKDDQLRDGKRALALAKQYQELDPKNALAFELLATANAEVGDFESAVRWQQKAIDHPEIKDKSGAAVRLLLYKNKQPYRQDQLVVIGVFGS